MAVSGDHNEISVTEAQKIAECASQKGISLRVMGACGVKLHSHGLKDLLERLQRMIGDIDVLTLKEERAKLEKFFTALGYLPNLRFNTFHGDSRQFFDRPSDNLHVDVFIEKFRMCHDIDLASRLSLDFPTISVTDLLLTKLQIVEINDKDLKDVILLLCSHSIGNSAEDTIDCEHIARIMSDDWGFYYTATTNLGRTVQFADAFPTLSGEDRFRLREQVGVLTKRMEEEPKTNRWKKRAQDGPKKIWYRLIDSQRL